MPDPTRKFEVIAVNSCPSKISEELVSAYADGELTPAERDRVGKHLTGCTVCGALHQELLSLKTVLQTKSLAHEPQPYLWGRIQTHLNRQDTAASTGGTPLARWIIGHQWVPALAAVMVTLLAAMSLVRSLHRTSPVGPIGPAPMQTLNVSQLVQGYQSHVNGVQGTQCQVQQGFANTQAATTWAAQQVGYPVFLPQVEDAGYRVESAIACGCIAKGKSALFVCRKGNRTAGFVQFSPQNGAMSCPGSCPRRFNNHDAMVVKTDPYEVIGWNNPETSFAVLGDNQDTADLEQLASLPVPQCNQQP